MGSNQYNIKYSSMDQFYVDICTKTQGWYNQLDSWKSSYTSIINMNTFNGESATAVKSYLGEVHEFLIQSIYVAISRFQADFLLYKNQYYDIEDNIYANMSRETIKSIENRLNNEIKYLNNISNEIDRSIRSVSDIYWRGKPSKATLEGYLNSEKKSLEAFNISIENYENKKYAVANGELKSLLEALKSTLVMYSTSRNSVLSYKSGDLCNNTKVLDLYKKVEASTEYVENNKEEIELAALNQQEVFSQMQKDYEKALETREDEGTVKIITGVIAVGVGGAAIFFTAGAATPIVATAWVTGTCSAAYGVSNMVEGGQDVYYASIGNLSSVAINPIRDTVFVGNQGAYDLWGNLNMAVAGLCIPVSQAVNGVAGASKSVIAKTAAIRVSKDIAAGAAINYGSNKITNFAAKELNLNQTESTVLNLGLNVGMGVGAYKFGSKFFGKSSFAEGMNYEDAKRYNNYWKELEAGNNTRYPGLTDAEIKTWKLADNKLNENIALKKIDSNEIVKLRMEKLKIENGLRAVDEGGGNPSKVFKTTQELLKETTCSNEKLYQYLKSNDAYFKTSYAEQYLNTGKWPDDLQIPKSSDVLTSKGSIDWSQVPDSGYVLDSSGKAIKETYFPKKGEIIDRYGLSDGTFTSPVIDDKSYSYDNRSLPYIDDLAKYHQYELTDDLSKLSDYIRNCTDKELVQDINDFMAYKKIKSYDDLISYKGEIAPGFGSSGGGLQYQLPLPVDILEELGFLKMIK